MGRHYVVRETPNLGNALEQLAPEVSPTICHQEGGCREDRQPPITEDVRRRRRRHVLRWDTQAHPR